MEKQSTETSIALMQKDIKIILKFIENAPKHFASKITEKLVYGIVGIVLIAVGSALVAGVVRAAELLINWSL